MGWKLSSERAACGKAAREIEACEWMRVASVKQRITMQRALQCVQFWQIFPFFQVKRVAKTCLPYEILAAGLVLTGCEQGLVAEPIRIVSDPSG